MGWVKLSDDFPNHPKVVSVGPYGIALYVAGLCYCNRYLTDGRIPDGIVATLLDFTDASYDEQRDEYNARGFASEIAATLVKAGLWTKNGNGWVVHDYAEYQPLKAKVLQKRKKDNARRPPQGRRGIQREST